MSEQKTVEFKFDLKDQPDARALTQYLGIQDQYAFFSNHDIAGSLSMKPVNCSEMNFSSLCIQLLMKKNSDQKVLAEYQPESNQSLAQNKEISFSFTGRELESSYHGKKVNVQYFLMVKLQRKFKRSITYSEELIVLDINSYQKNSFPSPVKLIPKHEDPYISLYLPSNEFGLDGKIIGTVLFSEIKTKRISEINLAIINIETIKTKKDSKKFTYTIHDHQIVTGCPRSHYEVPFILPLQGLGIWPSNSDIDSKFYLEIQVLFQGEILLREKTEIIILFPRKKSTSLIIF